MRVFSILFLRVVIFKPEIVSRRFRAKFLRVTNFGNISSPQEALLTQNSSSTDDFASKVSKSIQFICAFVDAHTADHFIKTMVFRVVESASVWVELVASDQS